MFDAKAAARFMQAYAKNHHAGAFATPLAKELTPANCRILANGNSQTVYAHKTLTKPSTRKDFTGRKYVLPAGARVVTHVARTPDAPIPNFDDFDYVFAYAEDRMLTAGLHSQGKRPTARTVTAASELVACWGHPALEHPYTEVDVRTVGQIKDQLPPFDRDTVLAEALALTEWHDDFPFYSDGSWSALNLRGFYPEDPLRGIKPAEMPRQWKQENPQDLNRSCDWTTLADRCPTITTLVTDTPQWRNLERVRLLRMAGRNGQGGVLRRHTDITDRNAGTADGHIARFHLPITTHPDIKLSAWNLDGTRRNLHLAQWGCYYLDARKPHAVTNPTGTDRIHLVIDVIADETTRNIIQQSTELVA